VSEMVKIRATWLTVGVHWTDIEAATPHTNNGFCIAPLVLMQRGTVGGDFKGAGAPLGEPFSLSERLGKLGYPSGAGFPLEEPNGPMEPGTGRPNKRTSEDILPSGFLTWTL